MSKSRSDPINFGDLSEFKETETLNDDYGDGYYEEAYEDDALSKKASRDVLALTIAFLVIIVLCFVAVITLNTLRGGYKPPVLDTSTIIIGTESSKSSSTPPESKVAPNNPTESKPETETETTSSDSESDAESSSLTEESKEDSKKPESREETIVSKPESSTESSQELTSSTIEPEPSAETSYFEAESSAETSYFEPEPKEESLITNSESEYADISQEPDFSEENNPEEESSMISETEPTFDEGVIDLDPEIPGTQAP